MKMNKKIVLLTMLIILLIPICSFAKVYEKVDTQILTSGAKLNNITKFTSNGWLYLNVIEVDMTNSNIKLDSIISESGVSHLSNMKNMANYNNVIAAINADYFAKRADETNRGQAIGFTASDGKIINSSADENLTKDTMSTFILNNDNTILYTFLKDEISLYSYDTGATSYVADINKFIPLEAQCCIFTSDWGYKTIGNSKGQYMIELVVENNIVTEIREDMEGTSIPQNGYVVSGYGKYGDFLLNNFKVGSKIKYDININLNIDTTKMAISGGSILVKDGVIPPFTHVIYGKHEFTAIGSSKDNNTVYLVTVTNNNSGTLGITQKELATILKDYGIYNAINLDGGGSTTMVARQEGQTEITNINLPNNSYLRPVVNGVGIFSLAEKSNLASLSINFDYENIFVNDSTGFTLKGFDKYNNPVEINKQANISFSNSNAKYEDGKIIGKSEGIVTVIATIDDIYITKQLRVLGDIYSLEISPKTITVEPGKTQNFSLIAYDKNGYSKTIDNSVATWEVDNNGTISNGTYTAPSISGTNIVIASANDVKAYAKISIPAKQTVMYDDFESIKGKFSSYPHTVTGNISLSDKSKTGSNSLKLTYDFTTNDTVKGAYYDYTNILNLPDSITEIGFWVYNPIKNANSLKSQYKDANGNTQVAIIKESLSWTGWEYVTYPNPSNVHGIVSIYVAQGDNSTTKTNSYINMDSLYVSYYGVKNNNTHIPTNITKQDVYNYINSSSTFNIGIVEELKTPTTLFDKIKVNKLINQLNENSNLVVFNKNSSNNNLLTNLYCDHVSNTGFTMTDKNNCTIITLDASSSGIKNTNFNQWEQLLDNISDTNKNTFIVLNNSLDNFTDKLEKQLLIDILVEEKEKTGNNYWIIEKGSVTQNRNYNGIKILTIGNDAIPSTDINVNIDNYSYIQIYIDSNDISYDIKNVF